MRDADGYKSIYFPGCNRSWIHSSTYVATITAESVNINKSQDSEEVLMTARQGMYMKFWRIWETDG